LKSRKTADIYKINTVSSVIKARCKKGGSKNELSKTNL